MAPWGIGVRCVKTALQVVDWHHAETTAAERNRVVVIYTAPGASHSHVCLTVAHRLVGQALQVRIGILFAFPPFVVSFWMLWVVGAPVAFIGVILPIYTIIDMIETAENVWSDSCVSAMVDKDLT